MSGDVSDSFGRWYQMVSDDIKTCVVHLLMFYCVSLMFSYIVILNMTFNLFFRVIILFFCMYFCFVLSHCCCYSPIALANGISFVK